ncbi:hypothetical protein THAOC_20914 [Thalassiosira oceanica]|uniref:Uncharacterized protein n=1 Tax=Thalassiosira oceanica TaxID=159749 RepID=K0S279_THAOC|nr:hypothetical protein THAOC_20914 [Thalassiosira oceanica]|eukprot:EJK58924.1 hypothetical protein THAOC_20914 [Thalassiosira oceanica]
MGAVDTSSTTRTGSATRASSHAPLASSPTFRHPSRTPAYSGAKFDVGGCCLVHPSVRLCRPTSNGGYKIIRKTCHLCPSLKTMDKKKRPVGFAPSRSRPKGRDLRQDLVRALSQFTSTAALLNGRLPSKNDVDVPSEIEIDISSHCDSEREGVIVKGSTKDELLIHDGSAQDVQDREFEPLRTLTESAVLNGERWNDSDASGETLPVTEIDLSESTRTSISAKELKEMVNVDILKLSTGTCDVLKLSTGAVQDGRMNSDMSEVLTNEIFVENNPRVLRSQETDLTAFTFDSPNEERLNDKAVQDNELKKGYGKRTTALTETTADITLSEQPQDDDEDGGDKPVRTRSEYIRQYESLTRAQSILKFVRDRIDDVKSMSASEIKVVRCKSPNGEVKTVPMYSKGTEVYYRSFNAAGEANLLKAIVVGSHQDNLLEPYYTIQMGDGREKQTDNDHLIFAP